jgi:hypothetical protein
VLDDRGAIQAHVLEAHGRLTAAKGSRRSLLRIVRRWCSLCWRLSNWLSGSLRNWLCDSFSNWLRSRLNNWSLSDGSLFSNRDLFSHWCRLGKDFDWLLKDRVQNLASLSTLLTK